MHLLLIGPKHCILLSVASISTSDPWFGLPVHIKLAKLAYNTHILVRWLAQLVAIIFTQLGQYAGCVVSHHFLNGGYHYVTSNGGWGGEGM